MRIPQIHLSFGPHTFSYYDTRDIDTEPEAPAEPDPTEPEEEAQPSQDYWSTPFGGQTLEKLAEGAEPSPAGLVVGGSRTEENDVFSTDPDSEFVRGGEPGADPEPEFIVGEGEIEAPSFKTGDRVVASGCSFFNWNADGKTGTILVRTRNTPDDYEYVDFGSGERKFMRASRLRLLPAPTPFDDLAALEEVKPNYAGDTRLVDLVAKGLYETARERYPSWVDWEERIDFIKDVWRKAARETLEGKSDDEEGSNG